MIDTDETPGGQQVTIISVNVGQPREIEWRGATVRTSIFKSPVAGRVRVIGHNLEGDAQSDLTVHGGPNKAVYVYPSEHYALWKAELPDTEFPWGAFGENLTTEGWSEDLVYIGDRFSCGSAEFIVTQPRQPCYKLGVRFDRLDMVKRFHRSKRCGFYLAVVTEGELGAGDSMTRVSTPRGRVSVAEAYLDITG
jgi:MOSC domain-containing protein YiiM